MSWEINKKMFIKNKKKTNNFYRENFTETNKELFYTYKKQKHHNTLTMKA